jgi:hypothetical protein
MIWSVSTSFANNTQELSLSLCPHTAEASGFDKRHQPVTVSTKTPDLWSILAQNQWLSSNLLDLSKQPTSQPLNRKEEGPPPPPADNEVFDEEVEPTPRPRYEKHRRTPSRAYRSAPYRRTPRYIPRRSEERVRMWWSLETGIYISSFESTANLEFIGFMFGGRIGMGWKSLILAFDVAAALSITEDKNFQTGGWMGQVGGSIGWAFSRYIIVDIGLSAHYLSMYHRDLHAGSLIFPLHLGATFRIPVGKIAIGLRSATYIAGDLSGRFYFSSTANLVIQAL